MKLKRLANTVKADVRYGAPYNPEFKNSNGWTITLSYQRRRMTIPFYTGSAITKEPTSYDVLYCVLGDASTIENTRGFRDWCSDLGYDEDSRKAEKIYKQCLSQTAKLKKLLGKDYEMFMNADMD
jgi:hypothetical protein